MSGSYKPIGNEIFHVHTWRCKHASDEADYCYVDKAIELGVSRIVFTDHTPFPGNPFHNRMDIEQLPEYISSMEQLKRDYASEIEILFGLEVEYLPMYHEFIKELHDSGDFDLLILGQHIYENEDGTWSFENLDKSDEFKGICEAMVQGIETGFFQVAAHPDRMFCRCKEWNQEMMRASYAISNAVLKHSGMLLEQNYSSMERKRQYWQPFWDRASLAPTIKGYDAHSVEELETRWKKHNTPLAQADIMKLLGVM